MRDVFYDVTLFLVQFYIHVCYNTPSIGANDMLNFSLQSIFISKVVEKGPSQIAGMIVGDKLLMVCP